MFVNVFRLLPYSKMPCQAIICQSYCVHICFFVYGQKTNSCNLSFFFQLALPPILALITLLLFNSCNETDGFVLLLLLPKFSLIFLIFFF